MNLAHRFTPRTRGAVPVASAALSMLVVFALAAAPAVAQTGNQLELSATPTQAGFSTSRALGTPRAAGSP